MANTLHQLHRSGSEQESSHPSIHLPVISTGKSTRIRKSRTSRWRAVSLITVHIIIIAHIVQWLITGSTLSPVEPSEAMYTLNHGYLNAGMIFFALAIISTMIFGRFVCGWGCHLVAYQDLCAWLLKKTGIKPKPFRSRILLLGPLALAIYMFVWPTVYRVFMGIDRPRLSNHLMTTEFWATFPGPFVIVLTILMCGFILVYFLGSKGFCTYACPYGGFFSLADQISPGSILVTDACKHCGHCTATCTSNVRVHEEVALYGKVVDPGCMKCMDCISVCPNNALYFGFSKPSLGAKPDSPRRPVSYDFTIGEEIFMVIVGLTTLLIYRGLYDQMPLLLSMGIAAMTAYVSMKMIRILRTPNVRLQNLLLKRGGRLMRAGYVFCIACAAYGIFTLHSAFIRYHAFTGQRLVAGLHLGDEVWQQGVHWWDRATPEQQLRVDDAVRRLERVDHWGLFATPTVLKDMVWLYLAKNQVQPAEVAVQRIIRLLPGQSEPRRGLAGVYRKSGRWNEAVDQYREALSIKPDYAQARSELCALLVSMGRMDEAMEEFREAVRVEPTSADAHYHLAMALLNQRNIEEAVEHLTRTVELNPEAQPAYYNLGVATFMTGRVADALPSIQTAIRLQPEDADAYGFLAVVLEQLGDLDGAQKARTESNRLKSQQNSSSP